jgi:hypothetical protein
MVIGTAARYSCVLRWPGASHISMLLVVMHHCLPCRGGSCNAAAANAMPPWLNGLDSVRVNSCTRINKGDFNKGLQVSGARFGGGRAGRMSVQSVAPSWGFKVRAVHFVERRASV